jgi:hypothetical protein
MSEQVILKGWRQHQPHQVECESLGEAIDTARGAISEASWYPSEIADLDGKVLMNEKELWDIAF